MGWVGDSLDSSDSTRIWALFRMIARDTYALSRMKHCLVNRVRRQVGTFLLSVDRAIYGFVQYSGYSMLTRHCQTLTHIWIGFILNVDTRVGSIAQEFLFAFDGDNVQQSSTNVGCD